MRHLAVACLVALFAAVPSPALAAPGAAATAIDVDIRFTAAEVSIIEEYYAREGNGRSGRKGGKGGLSPGIAKNLARGKPLPPGIAKQVLPGELLSRLPRAPDGYERIIVDGKILLVEVATQVVRDILTDIVFD